MSKPKDTRLEEKEELVVNGTILADEFRDRKTGQPISYTREQVNAMLKAIREGQYVEVDTEEYATLEAFLASEGKQGTVYLYPVGNQANNYYQYIWEVNEWVSLGTTQLDLSGYVKFTDDCVLNVINGTDIESNILSQAQYDLITNGKPTLLIGNYRGYSNAVLLPTKASGASDYGNAFVMAGSGVGTIIGFLINQNSKEMSWRTGYNSNATSIQSLFQLNGKIIPAYPADTGTFVLKCVGGVLTWVEEV